MIVIITVNDPDNRLKDAVGALSGGGVRFVIAESCSEEDASALLSLAAREDVSVTHLPRGTGRGAALKAALSYAGGICSANECVLTLAENASSPASAAKAVAEAWEKQGAGLVLGGFDDDKRMKLPRRVSTKLRRSIFAFTSGARVRDIESGLRAFSSDMIPELLQLKGDSHDFELAVLFHAQRQRYEFAELEFGPSTGPLPERRKFSDSWHVYRTILAFMLSSFGCSIIDYATVMTSSTLLPLLSSAIRTDSATSLLPIFGLTVDTKLIALILGRFVGSTCNFLFNRKLVFRSTGWSSMIKYFTVVAGLLAVNYLLIHLITGEGGVPLWLAQPIVQTALYPLNFLLQRKWVFRTKDNKKSLE